MNENTLERVRSELETALIGRRFGKVFSLSRSQIAIDFRLDGQRYLFISIEPGDPRTYLVKRRLKDLDKRSGSPSRFAQVLRARLAGSRVESVSKDPNERILRLELAGENDAGAPVTHTLVIQLTGRSANLFLLDNAGVVVDSMREGRTEGQEPGQVYGPPAKHSSQRVDDRENDPVMGGDDTSSVSEALDAYYSEKEADDRFRNRAEAERKKLRAEITKREKLVGKLRADLAGHGDAEKWKRNGDLILASLETARRTGGTIYVADLFDPETPEVAIAADENDSLTETAEKYFRRYTKARNAAVEITKRISVIEKELEQLIAARQTLETAIEEGDESGFSVVADKGRETGRPVRSKPGESKGFTGARRFRSSDGMEILVGKKAKDNDHLTFRVAKSLDLWLHAADYPGSHVIVRNPNRGEVPYPTLLEAAQLAAFYSDARPQGKAAVHYTTKKFVNKPKGAAPGLVSLASFKTILVEPKVPDTAENEDARN